MEVKEDCFAYKENQCNILDKLECDNCKFYKNNLKQSDIERSIKTYTKTYGNN